MDDFEDRTRKKSKWDKQPQIQFDISLRSMDKDPEELSLVVHFAMTPMYPHTAPEISFGERSNVTDTQIKVLENRLKEIFKELKGQEMVFEITSYIQEKLDEFQNNVTTSSLEDERLQRIKEEEEKIII